MVAAAAADRGWRLADQSWSDYGKALGRPAAPRLFLFASVSSNGLLLQLGGALGPARAHCSGALQFAPCAVRALAATETLPSVTSGRFSPLPTAELPRNHYNSPSGFDPALRCYTSPGRTSLDGRSRSSGFKSSFYLSCLLCFFSIQPTRSACRGITNHRTITAERYRALFLFLRHRANIPKLCGSP